MLKPSERSQLSDGEILDLIEDFLVNNLCLEDAEAGDPGSPIEMLTHISELVDLRESKPSREGSTQKQLTVHVRSLRAALEFGAYKHAAAALRDLSIGLGCAEEPQTLLALFERKYIATGYLYSGMMTEKELEGFEAELQQLLSTEIIARRNCSIPSFKLSASVRRGLIKAFGLDEKWNLEAPYFDPCGEHGEITDLGREPSAT